MPRCASVSRNELIHTVLGRQLRFLGHTCSPHASTFGLYQPSHGTTRRGRPRLNYVNYVERLRTGGGGTRSRSLAWTCGRVRWSTTTWLGRERGNSCAISLSNSFGIICSTSVNAYSVYCYFRSGITVRWVLKIARRITFWLFNFVLCCAL